MDFIEQWVGASYPFQSLKIVFLDNIVESVSTAATIITAKFFELISVNLLVPENVVDQVYHSRYYLSFAIGTQWFGHYLTGACWDDSWLIIGLCRVLAYMFMRKLYGHNEYKFRLAKDTERICLIDVRMPPLCSVNVDAKKELLVGKGKNFNEQFDIFNDPCSLRAEVLHLKSGLVLLMMEKRFGKQLLAKLVSKFLMSQMSGELNMGLGTIDFLKMSRKISGHLEIKEFADQWIYGSGCPIFTTSYNFNRKKMVIELKIGQRSSNEGMSGATSKFTGPFTVRVQEPGGTFDTEIRIEEFQKQYDIIYHTKYKRIRRGAIRKGKKNADDEEEDEIIEDGDEDFSTDVIAEPDRITFEWIRLDPEKHWLSHLTFEQDAFMWNSLVKQVKDVDAQYEAIVALGKIHTIPTGIKLSEFLVDENLFYRLRMEAALALSKFDSEEVDYLGLNNLCKYLEEKYMIPDGDAGQLIPKRNHYEQMHDYYIKHTILYALCNYRDSRGWSPPRIREIILNFLSLNDNGGSQYSDSNTLAVLIDCLGMSFLPRPKNRDDLAWCLSERIKFKESRTFRSEDVEEFDFPMVEETFSHRNCEIAKNFFVPEDDELLERSLEEIARYLVKDRFNSSYKNAVTVSCLEVLLKWQIAGLVPINVPFFLQYSRVGHNSMVRKMAIECLIIVTALKDRAVNRYLALMCIYDKVPYISYLTAKNLTYFIGLAAQQLETSSHASTRKDILKAEVEEMISIWQPSLEAKKVPEGASKYIRKIMILSKELFPAKTKIKFKMPSLANLKPEDTDSLGSDTPKSKKKTPKVAKAVLVKIEETFVLPDFLIKCLAMVKKLNATKQGVWFRTPVYLID